jgi:methyltransferase-like protein
VTLNRRPGADQIESFRISGNVEPLAFRPDCRGRVAEEFRELGGETVLRTDSPSVKAILHSLSDIWPRAVSLDELLTMVRSRLGPLVNAGAALGEEGRKRLAEVLLRCYFANFVELHIHVPHFLTEVSERPLASALARILTEEEGPLTNLRHRSIDVNEFDRFVLRLLDGSRDRRVLLEELKAAESELALQDCERALDSCLAQLARHAFLIG